MSRTHTIESIITTGFAIVGGLLILWLLIAGIAMDYLRKPATTRFSQAQTRELPSLIQQTCTVAGNVAVQAAQARARGEHSSVLINQLHNLESHSAIKMPGMLAWHTEIVLSVYSKPTLTPQSARAFHEDLCTRVFAKETR